MSFTTPTVDVYVSGTTLGIGNVNAGTINIGKTTTQINVGGATTFTNSSTTVNGLLSVSNISTTTINPISSDLSIGNLQTTSILNLGNGARTGAINIGSSLATGDINIQTSGTMLIGNVTGPAFTTRDIKINGTDTSSSRIYGTNIGSFRFRNGTGFNELNITDQTSTGYIAIADRQNTGELRIGGGAGVTRTGSIRIGCETGNNCAVDIYTANGTTTSGSVNIAHGTQQTTPVNIAANTGTGLVTIGNSSNTTTLASGTLNIGNSNSIINIGGSLYVPGNTNLPVLEVDGGIMNTIEDIDSYSFMVEPIELTMIGQTYLLYKSSDSYDFPDISDTNLLSIEIMYTGIYTVCYHVTYGANSSETAIKLIKTFLNISSPSIYNKLASNFLGNNSSIKIRTPRPCMTGSWTGLINADAVISLIAYIEYASGTDGILLGGLSNNYLSITRIA